MRRFLIATAVLAAASVAHATTPTFEVQPYSQTVSTDQNGSLLWQSGWTAETNISSNWSLVQVSDGRDGGCSGIIPSIPSPNPIGLQHVQSIFLGGITNLSPSTTAYARWFTRGIHASAPATGAERDYCFRLRACDANNSSDCAYSNTFELTVNDGGATGSLLQMHQYVAREGNTQPVRVLMEPRNTYISPNTPLSTLLSLVSCPAGATDCDGSTVPPWVELHLYDTGIVFDLEPPKGSRGSWRFRVTLPNESGVTRDFVIRVLDTKYIEPDPKLAALGVDRSNLWASLEQHYPEEEPYNDTPATAPYLDRGYVIGDILPVGESDYYSVWVPDDEHHTFEVFDRSGTGCPFDARLEIREMNPDGSAGAVLFSDDASGLGSCPKIELALLEGQKGYLVRVREDGDNAVGYEYVLQHRYYVREVEEIANDSNNNDSGDGSYPFQYMGEQIYEPGWYGSLPTRFTNLTAGPDHDWAKIWLIQGDQLVVKTSDGAGGCTTGPANLALYELDSTVAPSLAPVSTTVTTPSDGCRQLTFTVPSSGNFTNPTRQEYWVRVSGELFNANSFYVAEVQRTPAAHSASFGFVDDGIWTTSYSIDPGSCGGLFGFFPGDVSNGADFYTGFRTYSQSPNCTTNFGSYGEDGSLLCRDRFESDVLSYANWDMRPTPFGLRVASPGTYVDLHMVAYRADTSPASAESGVVGSTATTLNVTLDTSPGNHFYLDPYGSCQFQEYPDTDCKLGDGPGFYSGYANYGRCLLDTSRYYYEGERFSVEMTRLNTATTVTAYKCSGWGETGRDGCSALPSSEWNYDHSTNLFTWDIPYTTGSTNVYIRLEAAGSGLSTAAYEFRVRVVNRATPPSGGDLMFLTTSERRPLAWVDYDPRLTLAAMDINDRAKNRWAGAAYYSQYLTNVEYGRSLQRFDVVQAHPFFERGRYGVPKGPTTLEVTLKNRGGSGTTSRTVQAFLRPAFANSAGDLTSTPPTGLDTPYATATVPALAANEVASPLTFELPAHDVLTQVGGEPWLGGARAVYLKVTGTDADSSNNVVGPYFITPALSPQSAPATSCPLGVGTAPGFAGAGCGSDDVTGSIATIDPASPEEGDLVSVNVQVQFYGSSSWSGSDLYFWEDRSGTVGIGTVPDQSSTFPSSPNEGTLYGYTYTFTAAKPDRADNVVYLRALLDANDDVVEAGSGEANNWLPSYADAYELQIANTPPIFTSSPGTTATEDTTYSYSVVFDDANAVDFSRLTLSLDDGPAGMSLGSVSTCGTAKCATLTWVPTDAQAVVGTHTVDLTACDGDPVAGGAGDCETQSWAIDVTRVNDPPVIYTNSGCTTPSTSGSEGTGYSYTVCATDEESGSLTFALTAPSPAVGDMSLTRNGDQVSADFTWTPDDESYPSENLTVRVTDGGGKTDTLSWTVNVANANDNPTLGAPSDTTADEGSPYSAFLPIADEDEDVAGITQAFSCTRGAGTPTWLTVGTDNTRNRCTISGTPTNAQTGTPTVRVNVSDGNGGSGFSTYTLTVSDVVNDEPAFDAVSSPQAATQGSPFSLTANVTDADFNSPGYSEDLTFTQPSAGAMNANPSGVSLTDNGQSVTITWTPGPSDALTSPNITVYVADIRTGSVDDTLVFTVNVANVNDAPVLAQPPDDGVQEAALWSLDLSAYASDADEDAGVAGESLTYTVEAGAPPNLTVNPSSGLLSLTGDDEDVGSWDVTVRVTDAANEFDEKTFELVVTNLEEDPFITSFADPTIDEDDAWTFDVPGGDPDGDAVLTWSLPTKPAGMSINGSGQISWTPDNGDALNSPHAVQVRLEDNTARVVTFDFDVFVDNVNDDPIVDSGAPPTSVQEESTYSYTFAASDVDPGDSVTLSAPTKPGWLSFNAVTGELTGTPDDPQVGGPYSVTLRATDENSGVTDLSFGVTVTAFNDAPVMNDPGSQSVPEGDLLEFTVSASDVDGPSLTISMSSMTLPPAAVFSSGTNTFTWDTDFGDEGTYEARFTVTDGGKSDFVDVVITVGDVNRPPVLASIGPQVIAEGSQLTITPTATDPDGDTVTITATGVTGANPFPEGATFTGGVFTWTPPYDAAGTWQVDFEASDAEYADSERVVITVTDNNRAPTITTTAPTSVDEDDAYSYAAAATDPDGDSLGWSLTTAPTGMAISAGGLVTWSPAQADVGSHPVVIEVSDGNGGSDTESYTLVVSNVNDAPVITSTAVTSVQEESSYSYTLTATDEDPGATVTLSAETLPSWLTFVPSTGALTGDPDDAEVGDHSVVLRATDDLSAFVEQSFTVTVSPLNDPPVLVDPTPSGTVSVAEGDTLVFTVAADDPDGPSLTYTASGMPAGASLDPDTGAFSWTPGFSDSGDRALTLQVSDGLEVDTRAITLSVSNTDRAPTINAPSTASGVESQEILFSVSVSDPDGDAVTVTMTDGPAGASFDGPTRTFTWTPGFGTEGEYTATFEAASGSLTATDSTTITVADFNRPPTVDTTAPTTATEDQPYSYDADATDPDGDTVTWQFIAGPANATLDPATGVLAWTPTGSQTGTRNFTLRATDGKVGGDTDHAFSVDVAAVNDAPVITSTPVTTTDEDLQWSYVVAATDEEGGALTLSLPTAPAGVAINQTQGSISWLPGNVDVGDHPITVRVTDPDDGLDEQSFTLTVVNVNDAPVIAASPAPSATVNERATWTWTPDVSDVDAGDTVTLTLLIAPAGMTLSGGVLSWTTEAADVGVHDVRLRAQDAAGATDVVDLQIEVLNLNDDPFFTSAPLDETVAEEDALVVSVFADDVDVDDDLFFSVIGAPANLSIDTDSGQILFAPDDDEVGTHNFTVRVEDLAGDFAEQAATVVVTPVNDAPVLDPIGTQQTDPGVELVVNLGAADPDGPSLTYSVEGAPAGAELTGNVFRWTPAAGDEGLYVVTFTVTDGTETDSEEVFLRVGSGDLPPALTIPDDVTVDELEQVTGLVSAVDPQGGTPTLGVEDLPDGATFNPASGAFAWVPSYDQSGVWAVVFTAENDAGVSRRTWNVTVRDVNRAPAITTVTLTAAIEGEMYSEPLLATDADGDALTWALIEGPAGLMLDPDTGALTFLPGFDDVGLPDVVVRVQDGRGGFDERTYSLLVLARDDDGDQLPDTWEEMNGTDPTVDDADEDPDEDGLTNLEEFLAGKDPFVSNAPLAPVLLSPPAGERLDTPRPTLLFAESSDPDGDELSYRTWLALESDPDGVVWEAVGLVPTDAEISVDVDVDLTENGRYLWRASAFDGEGLSAPGESRLLVVDAVNEPPTAPQVISPPDGTTIAVTTPTLSVTPSSDPDGDALVYRFRVYEDQVSAATIVSEAIEQTEPGVVRFELPEVLADGVTRFWEAAAVDARGLEGPASSRARFVVDLQNLPPPTPAIVRPAVDEVLTSNPVELAVTEVTDPESAPVTTRFTLAPDETFPSGVTSLFESTTATAGEVAVSAGDLADGTWHWRAVADDGFAASDPVLGRFVVDTINDPPPVPTQVSPANNSLVPALDVDLVANAVEDPEALPLTYSFELTSPDGLTVLDSATDVADADDGADDGEVTASFTGLTGGERYGWRVRADDPAGGDSGFSELWTFRVEYVNTPPDAPVLVSPEDGATLTNPTPTFVFDQAVDADDDAVVHDLEVYVDDLLAWQETSLGADAMGEVTATPSNPLPPGEVRWRARGRDMVTGGAWAERTFTLVGVDAGPEVDAGPLADAGGPGVDGGDVDVDDGGVDWGPDGPPPVVVPVGDEPVRLEPACNCRASGEGQAAPVGALALLAVAFALRRRRK